MSLVGNLEDLGLGDILQIIGLSRKSGVLSLQSHGREGEIIFLHGQVVHATSSVFPENFGALLVRRSVVERDTLKKALALQKDLDEPTLLGVVLAQHFSVSPELVEMVAREQVERIIYSFFGWSEGAFAFELGDAEELAAAKLSPHQRILQQSLNTQWLAIEGSRIYDEQLHWVPGSAASAEADGQAGRADFRRREAGGPPDPKHSYDFVADLLAEIGEQDGGDDGESALPLGRLEQLRGMFQELNNPCLGGGIILLVLRFASEFMNRAVVFRVQEQEIVGLGQFGIELGDVSADERIRKMRIPIGEDSIFSELLTSKMAQRVHFGGGRWDKYLKENLGGEDAAEIFRAPLVSSGRVVAILNGDNLPEATSVVETEALEIFLMHAGLIMEKALLERRLQEQASN
ncbi:MAG: DUF4388 domain-containing protein [Desulfuromonadaceae bacterium]